MASPARHPESVTPPAASRPAERPLLAYAEQALRGVIGALSSRWNDRRATSAAQRRGAASAGVTGGHGPETPARPTSIPPEPEPETLRFVSTSELAEAPATPALLLRLRHQSAEIASDAARRLSSRSDPEVVAALRDVVENLAGYFHTSTRAAALGSLATLLPPGSDDIFLEAVADADADVSVAAITALVDRSSPEASEVLVTVVENLSGFYLAVTRHAAARGLQRLGAHVARLAELCLSEPDPDIRAALLRAMN